MAPNVKAPTRRQAAARLLPVDPKEHLTDNTAALDMFVGVELVLGRHKGLDTNDFKVSHTHCTLQVVAGKGASTISVQAHKAVFIERSSAVSDKSSVVTVPKGSTGQVRRCAFSACHVTLRCLACHDTPDTAA